MFVGFFFENFERLSKNDIFSERNSCKKRHKTIKWGPYFVSIVTGSCIKMSPFFNVTARFWEIEISKQRSLKFTTILKIEAKIDLFLTTISIFIYCYWVVINYMEIRRTTIWRSFPCVFCRFLGKLFENTSNARQKLQFFGHFNRNDSKNRERAKKWPKIGRTLFNCIFRNKFYFQL